MNKIAYITHPDCLLHEMGTIHPESAERLKAIGAAVLAQGLDRQCRVLEAPLASEEALCRVHAGTYVELVQNAVPHAGFVHLNTDTAMNPHTLKAALRAAGAGVLAVDLVLNGEVDHAFCAVRPPGHHALRDAAMGFCIFNNIAVAVAHALAFHGLERVAIIDFDVHHGNGTERIFSDDPRVLMCGIYQHPFFPYSASGEKTENMLNVPLPAGAGSAEFRTAVERQWLPRLERFRPQMVFISAGFDAHRDDEMGGLELVDEDYVWCTGMLKALAGRHAQGRLVSMLEGGYNLEVLARCVAAHLKVLLG